MNKRKLSHRLGARGGAFSVRRWRFLMPSKPLFILLASWSPSMSASPRAKSDAMESSASPIEPGLRGTIFNPSTSSMSMVASWEWVCACEGRRGRLGCGGSFRIVCDDVAMYAGDDKFFLSLWNSTALSPFSSMSAVVNWDDMAGGRERGLHGEDRQVQVV